MRAGRLRAYADTSVLGGCLDDGFAEDSRAFLDEVRAGRFTLVVSSVTLRGLLDAPEEVRRMLPSLPPENVEYLPDCPEIVELRDAYTEAGVVGPGSMEEAEKRRVLLDRIQCDRVLGPFLQRVRHSASSRAQH